MTELTELEALVAKATPGPWDSAYDDYGDEIWFGGYGKGTWTVGPAFLGGDGATPDGKLRMDADAALIVYLVNNVPAILAQADAITRITRERDEARAAGVALRDDLLMRAEMHRRSNDGDLVVEASNGVWQRFCQALKGPSDE